MNLDGIISIIIPSVAVIALIAILASGYVKAPPDIAYIISGLRKKPKILIGRAGIKFPFLERKDILIVKQISIDIKTGGYIPTRDFIGVDIDAVAKVRVMTNEEVVIRNAQGEERSVPGIELAAKNFLNMHEKDIALALTDSLQGNMREIIGTVDLKELCNDRKSFGDQVQDKAQRDMNALGIEIISCNIQRITDEQNLINALGQDNMSQIKKNASIAKANADKDVAIAEADAKKAANDAQVIAETEIAQKQNELAIKRAQLKQEADVAQARADAAYKIQEQEQEKAIQEATVNAQIRKTERETELKQKQVEVKQQELDAEIKKVADAKKYAAEQEAAADLVRRQRQAEAEKYEQEQEALARMKKAEADKYEKEQEAEAKKAQADAKFVEMQKEADGIAARGKAEADAIKAKGLAEAEALEKKAEAMRKYGQAAMMEMVVKVLPQMAEAVAKPLESIDKVTIIDSGNGNDTGVGTMGSYVPQVLAKTIESIKETTGLDITEIMRAETYDAKVNKNINITGLDEPAKEKVKKTTRSRAKKTEDVANAEEFVSDMITVKGDE